MDCKVCTLDNKFWIDIDNPKNEKVLIREFYAHRIDPNIPCLNGELKLCAIKKEEAIKSLISILLKYSCKDILEIIKVNFEPFEIKAKDIPQFSDFNDCCYTVADKLVCIDSDGISYEKMGFLLRRPNTTRNSIADHKYGENHSKVAAAMGLCSFDNKCQLRLTNFGRMFQSLSMNEKKNLAPKLCLYIPLLQNIFVNGNTDDVMEHYLGILSESTQVRRRSNIKTLRNIITDSIYYGL